MDADERIEFYRHPLGEEEKQHLMGALDSPILTTGDAVSDAEHALAEYLDIEHVVCLDSYVGALHLTLKALGIRAGDEVIVPAMTFIATPNAVVMAGATPIFADVEPRTGCLTPDTIAPRITQRTKAIIPVHLYGLLCDMEALREFADDRSLILIEDSTDCFEARREGIRPGSHGRAACFSFYATRAITCGEGGAIATHDGDLARRVRKLSRFGIDTLPAERAGKPYRHWDMDEFGWKYNLDNIRGALLVPQIRKLYGHCQRRRDIAATYERAFQDLPGIEWPAVVDPEWSSRQVFPIWVDPHLRDDYLARFHEEGIGVAVNYRAAHLRRYYADRFGYHPGDLPIAEGIGDRTISIPLYSQLTDNEVDRVIEAVTEIVMCDEAALTAGAGT